MNGATATTPGALGGSKVGRPALVLLGLATIAGLVFIVAAALPYFALTEASFGRYYQVRGWLMVHIVTGMVALLTGPVQLWLGLTDRYPRLHHQMGFAYMAAVGVSSVAGYYLATHTSGGLVFGTGLAGLATAWLVTTSMAFVAIKRHLYDQHKEWMIRSYVVTFAFVTFRALQSSLAAASIGTLQDQIGIAAWFCWSVPLLVTEAVLQARKILPVRAD